MIKKKFSAGIILLLTSLTISCTYSQNTFDVSKYKIIDTESFQNSAHHWYDIHDKGNVINPRPGQKQYKATDLTDIGDNILLYQRNNGGWPKNYDMRAILTLDQKDSLIRVKDKFHTTFDNSTTFSHIECLARIYYVTKEDKYKDACLKGINFTLSAQYPNGGWPQYYPLESNYSRHITFNDGAYLGIMQMLKNIIDNEPCYSFVDPELRKKVKVAYDMGMDCLLNCQIMDNGRLTVWCQQHNENDLKPAWARAFEPPSICNGESADVVLFLMNIDHPGERIINAVQSAVKWFDDSKITETRVNIIKAPVEKSRWRNLNTDKVVVHDPAAPPIWTRYYELETDRPLFCDRDSKFLYKLSDVSRERRSGYGWYTYEPQKVLDRYPEWQKKWDPDKNILSDH